VTTTAGEAVGCWPGRPAKMHRMRLAVPALLPAHPAGAARVGSLSTIGVGWVFGVLIASHGTVYRTKRSESVYWSGVLCRGLGTRQGDAPRRP